MTAPARGPERESASPHHAQFDDTRIERFAADPGPIVAAGRLSWTRLSIDTGRDTPYELELTRHVVPVRALPGSLRDATLVQLSDFHAGFGGTEPVFDELVRQIRQLAPDLLVLTGDFIDDRACPRDYPLADLLRQFRAKLGVFACLGNHDHRRGAGQIRRLIEQAGVRLLCNEAVTLPCGLCIAAVDDMHEGRPDITRTFVTVPREVTSIVLSHNPRLIERMPDYDTLILSGHTHGGQIALTFPSPALVCRFHLHVRQVAGWYRSGRKQLYVNRGIGVTGRPYRYNCPAEISVFGLVPADDS